MKNKQISNFLIIALLLVISTNLVSANFVCGEVLDAEDRMASWYDVIIFPPQSSDKYTSCQVSPAGNKYCCDTEAIPGAAWKIGDTVSAEIFDAETGYVAGPVSIVTTGEGYDILPVMTLEKVIQVESPSKKVIVSEGKNTLIKAKMKSPYYSIDLQTKNTTYNICSDCNEIEENITSEFGMNEVVISAGSSSRKIEEKINFALLEKAELEREFICDKCSPRKVRSGEEVQMILNVNLSHSVENLKIKEYIPVEWEIIETDAEVKSYSSTHKVLIWNFSGSQISLQYKTKAPSINIIPKEQLFKTELEEYNLYNESILLYRWPIPIPRRRYKYQPDHNDTKKTVTISSQQPLVLRPNVSSISRMAVFPGGLMTDASLGIIEIFPEEKVSNAFKYYGFDSSMGANDVDNIYIEFEIEKAELERNGYKGISLYVLNEGWEKSTLNFMSEDENYNYYNSSINFSRGFVLVGEKPKGEGLPLDFIVRKIVFYKSFNEILRWILPQFFYFQ